MTNACVLILSGLFLLAPGDDGDVLFRDGFDTKLQTGWQWVREDKDEWRIRDGQLQVRSQFGRIWAGNDAKNLLLVGPLKSRNMAARVSVAHQPKEKYEQAGPLWYVDDDNFVKLISEQIDGKMYVVVARELAGRGKVVGKVVVPSANLQLRLVVQSNRVTGQWRLKDSDAWSESGSCDFDAKGSPRFGLFTQNGAKDKVRWVRFDDFVIADLTDVKMCVGDRNRGAECVVNVADRGAVGDGKTLSTEAIQKAVDHCAARGGGTVRLTAGTWLIGTVYLDSNVTLLLEKGATLLGSRKREDYGRLRISPIGTGEKNGYRSTAMLAGSGIENATIRGEGTIDGQGDAFRDKTKKRPKCIYLSHCRNVTVEGVRMRNAGSWMQHYRKCDGLTIRRINVFNHAAYNNDGLNVDSCRNVLIEDSRIDSDDDGIVIKSLSPIPCQNVVVRRCTISSHCNAIKLGTESGGGFRQINISDCVVHSPRKSKHFYGRDRGLAGIALEIVDGGTLDDVNVSNVDIDGVSVAIFLRLGNRARSYVKGSPKPGVGSFGKVVIRNVTAKNTSPIGCSITGLPGHPIKGVVLENIKLGFEGGADRELASKTVREKPESYPESTMFGTLPAFGFYCRHVESLVFRNIELRTSEPDGRHAMVFDDVKRLTLDGLTADRAKGSAATVRFTQVEEATIRNCTAPAGADPFLLVEGDRSGRIVLEKNDLGKAAKPWSPGKGASKEAVSTR